jgi:AcrR family transcriptional regulator
MRPWIVFACPFRVDAVRAVKTENPETVPAPKRRRSPKGEQARARLKSAALRVLERVGYHQIRIADVTTEAGVTPGLFYHYFADMKTLVLEVLREVVLRNEELDSIERGLPKGDWYEFIHAHILVAMRSYSENPGLIRCIIQVSDEIPEFGAWARARYREQLQLFTNHFARLFPQAGLGADKSLLLAYAAGGQAEAIIREYFLYGNDELPPMSGPEELTEILSVLFFRVLFLKNPPAEKLHYAWHWEKLA